MLAGLEVLPAEVVEERPGPVRRSLGRLGELDPALRPGEHRRPGPARRARTCVRRRRRASPRRPSRAAAKADSKSGKAAALSPLERRRRPRSRSTRIRTRGSSSCAASSSRRSPSSKRSRSPSTRASCVSASAPQRAEAAGCRVEVVEVPVRTQRVHHRSRRRKVLVVAEARTPLPAHGRERLHEHAARDGHPRTGRRAVDEGPPGRRGHARSLHVRILDGVDVDRLAVGVLRPASRAADEAAVEAGGVVGRHRRVVAAAVGRHRAQSADREARLPEPPKDRDDVAGDAAGDDDRPPPRPAAEVPVRDVQRAQARRPDRAARAIRVAQVAPAHRPDVRLERRRGAADEGRDEKRGCEHDLERTLERCWPWPC